jgi:hypothetical protein
MTTTFLSHADQLGSEQACLRTGEPVILGEAWSKLPKKADVFNTIFLDQFKSDSHDFA